ncbi:MAG: hypothetical protein V1921_08250 [Candidatus Altiarchaeota archaeon]
MYLRKDTNEGVIFHIIRNRSRIKVSELLLEAEKRNIDRKISREVVRSLLGSGRVYQPMRGVLELVEY